MITEWGQLSMNILKVLVQMLLFSSSQQLSKPSRRRISSFCSGERMGEFTASNQRVILLLAWKYSRRHAV
jgi:hypothetical protein